MATYIGRQFVHGCIGWNTGAIYGCDFFRFYVFDIDLEALIDLLCELVQQPIYRMTSRLHGDLVIASVTRVEITKHDIIRRESPVNRA